MTLDAFTTIIRPVVSEKATVLGDQGKYVFEVAPGANKIQIKQAVEQAFANKKVQVAAVNILHVAGKTRRRGKSIQRISTTSSLLTCKNRAISPEPMRQCAVRSCLGVRFATLR